MVGFVSAASLEDDSRFVSLLLMLALAVSVIWGLQMMPPNQTFHDESFHFPQIRAYFLGQYAHLENSLTMLPGYHFLVASLADVIGKSSVSGARLASFLLSVPAVIFFFLIAQHLQHRSALFSACLFYFSPIIFPFFYVIYTDIPSLSFVLAGVYFALKERFFWSGLFFILSLCLRQTNVVWAALMWGMSVWNLMEGRNFYGFSDRLRCFLLVTIRTAMLPVCGLLFLLFVILNGGVAIGDASAHVINQLYITQIYFWLLMAFVVFLPMHIRNLPRIWRLLRDRVELLIVVSLLFVLFVATFRADHGYNDFEFFLRNRVIIWVRESTLNKVLIFIPMCWAFLSLCVTPFRHTRFYLLYPVTALSLLPHSLIDQRYFMVSLTLLLLFKKDDSAAVDYLTLALYFPALCYLYSGVSKIQFFL